LPFCSFPCRQQWTFEPHKIDDLLLTSWLVMSNRVGNLDYRREDDWFHCPLVFNGFGFHISFQLEFTFGWSMMKKNEHENNGIVVRWNLQVLSILWLTKLLTETNYSQVMSGFKIVMDTQMVN
jgi:hypothetical protein